MSGKHKFARKKAGKPSPKKGRFPSKLVLFSLVLIFAVACAAVVFKSSSHSKDDTTLDFANHLPSAAALTPTNFESLVKIPPDQLERVDIGLMNLLCAQGLRGAENMDVA